MKIIFSGGGTGGHIYPAIALIKALNKSDESIEILYIGKIGAQEEKICRQENIPFFGINVRYFYRKLIYKNILTMYEFIKAYRSVKKLIKKFKPNFIIGTGGYVSAPVVYAGSKKKIKIIIHEQNSVPGLTNKFLSRYANVVAISFITSKKYFDEKKVVLTGNPRAQEVVETKKISKLKLGISEDKKIILFFMGSLGAKYVNETILKALPILTKRNDIQVIFVTGKNHYNNIVSEAHKLNINQNVFIKPYVDNMPELYKICDLVICRAGATSLAETSALGLPSILIPSPYVTNNHQEKNALDYVRANAARMIYEKDLTEVKLVNEVTELLDDPVALMNLKINCKKKGIPNACDKFIELIIG